MRRYAILLALVSVLVLNPVPASAAITPGDGTCDLTVGAGTSVAPFEITDAASLAEMIDCDADSTITFKLMNNIDATSLTSPIQDTNPSNYFQGVLDGNSKSISMSLAGASDIGLFHKIDGTVKDLSLSGTVSSTATSQGQSFGALAAWTYSNALIQNVSSSVVVDALDASGSGGALEVGGLIGTMTGGSLTDVTVTGIVQGKGSVGGVVGRAYGTVTITNALKSSGAITTYISPSNTADAGGVIGIADSGVQLVDIESRVTILARDFQTSKYVGGLAGRLSGSIDGGKVNSTLDIYGGSGTGGAVGLLAGGSLNEVEVAASVLVNSDSTDVGGLVGLGTGAFQITKSYSLADVKGYNSSVNGPQERVGGLVGKASSMGALIEDSFAAGAILEGSTGSGGLVGYLDGDLTINSSYAALPINSTAFQTGGLVGQVTVGSLLTTSAAFWDVDVTTESVTAENEGTGLSTSRFLDPDFLTGLDFSTIWGYNSAADAAYPRLRWTNTTPGYWGTELGFTIDYSRNGGSSGTLPTSVTQATSSTLTVPTADVGILKTNFDFGGWAVDPQATTPDTSITFDADKTLSAVWVSETVPPTVSGGVVAADGVAVTISFSEAMGAKAAPAGFDVIVDSVSATFTAGNVTDGGTTLVLTMSQAVAPGAVVTLDYDDTVGSLEDKALTPNALASFSGLSLTNNAVQNNGGGSSSGTPAVSGPILANFSSRVLDSCKPTSITITGSRLSESVLSIQGKPVKVIEQTSIKLVLEFPAGLTPGMNVDLLVTSSSGTLTHQDAFDVAGDNCIQSKTVSSWTKNLKDGSVKVYAKNIVGAGKIQFMVNGKEVAWVRAVDETDAKLREANGFYYLVRTVRLVPGQKNALEIYLDDERIWRAAYAG